MSAAVPALSGRPFSATRRWALWSLLVALIVALLAMLMWLAGRYESGQMQSLLESDVAEAVSDIRTSLLRNVQSFEALQSRNQLQPARWAPEAMDLLRAQRELVRIEQRGLDLVVLKHVDTPHRPPLFDRLGRSNAQPDVTLACTHAQRISGPAYSTSYFVPQSEGFGLQVMELCLPRMAAGSVIGYLVVTYSLQDMLSEMVGKQLARSQDVFFTDPDGTRLAFHGQARRGARSFSASHLLDLPGATLVLRLESWRGGPNLFPNFLTAMVAGMTLALVSVLVLLARDTRRRLRAERGLAEALAFRKAMEDSLVTGLRARDLQGRTTYVNPAFCQMVGFMADELLDTEALQQPYWPPERADEYRARQAVRLTGVSPPREGFETLFMRKDGARFPVMVFEAPLIDAQGRQAGWMSAFLDISEQRRVEELSRSTQERLQATARLAMVGEMASLLSHELNQPLAAIASYATGSINMLHDGTQADRQGLIAQALQHIAEQSQRAGRVIRSVHDFVRRREQVREVTDPRALIDAVMPLVSLQARKLSVRIVCMLEPGLPPVWCDRTMVEQVLLNLARNGMQAMDAPRDGPRELALRVRRAVSGDRHSDWQGWVEFSVSDTGTGIAPAVAERLFTPFFTTKAEGMGLGLSLCRTVVEQHGGHLVFGPLPGGGTVFRFTLPMALLQ
jgi:two-component system sensor histidine kinase DctS